MSSLITLPTMVSIVSLSYLEHENTVCTFVGSVSLSIDSVIHPVNVPVPSIELGTGKSKTLSTNTISVFLKPAWSIWREVEDVNRNMQWDKYLHMKKRMGY